ncbi:MAG: hypothetical protein ACYDCQ_02250 [Dehalococcoidia bacterium]
MSSRPRITEFVFDDENEDKIAEHGLRAYQLRQVLDNAYAIVPNRKRRRALWLVIGQDNSGACIAIPIEATRDQVRWRPITAWRCKDSDLARLG